MIDIPWRWTPPPSRPAAPPCPNIAEHTPSPADLQAWHLWSLQMHKTHTPTKCPGCGAFAIWIEGRMPMLQAIRTPEPERPPAKPRTARPKKGSLV